MMLLCMVMAVVQLYAQSRTITGKVTDNSGNPISNATIKVKGSTTGTTSDNSGNFRLTIPPTAKTLVISYIGFGDQEVAIGAQTSYSVSLAATSGSLDEVVVQVPYGTVKKTAFTGSEATVSAKQIERQKVTSVTKAIEGLAPGVLTTNGGGAPGSNAGILIRGFSSISASSTPLYVVNGAPYDGLITGIATEDIESVTILKDAAASALYGARAAGGVIMITTKSGKKGRANVTATFNQGFMSRGIPEYDRLSSKEYYELMWEATRNSFVYGSGQSFAAAGQNATNVLTGPTALVYNAYNVPGNQLVDPVTGKLNPNAQLRWTDSWEDVLFRTANRVNANVSVSGASDKSDYFLSMGYLKEEGTMKFTGLDRYTFRANVNTEATSYLKMGINMDASFSVRNDVTSGGSATSNPFYYTRNMGPIYPVYWYDVNTGALMKDANGNPMLDWGTPAQMGTRPYAGNSNLLGSLELDERSNRRFNGNLAPYVAISLHKNLTFKSTIAVNIWEDNATTYQNSLFGDASGVKGRSTKTFDRQLSLTFNQVLNWNKKFNDHSVNVLVGHENYRLRYDFVSATRTGFLFPNSTELTSGSVTEGQPSSGVDNLTLESYFASANYSFKERYLLSGSVRRDGSSRFAPESRWGTFYSAGIGWRISQENFLKNVNWLNDLKLKASYGEVGQQDIGSYYQYINWYYSNALGGYNQTQGREANPELKWEVSRKFNIGFDFAILKNRLQGTVEYFRNSNSDLLFDVPQQPSTGNLNVYQNVGSSRNSGIEIQLGYNAIRKKNFDWRIDVNFTHFKNVITQMAPVHEKTNGFVNGTKRLQTGYSQQEFWLREFAGVDAATGDGLYYIDILDATGKPTGQRGLTNDITKATFYFQGSAIPKFNGGVTNSFRYKNFDLSILVTYSYGGKFYDGNYAGLMHFGSYGTAWHSDILNRWQKPGDVTNVPRVQNAIGGTQEGASTRWLMDASYINIKNISLTYNLSKSIANKLRVSGLQVYANIDNVKLFAAKKGMDPQRAFTGTADATYPPFRTITFGLTANL